jgi:myo-inositol-1(or 4)-monophosphatase
MPTKMEAAINAALQAGELLKKRFRTDLEIREKSPTNLVTELDLQSERLILESLKSAFPEIPALSEEAESITTGLQSERWIIDPLDGTTNFAHGYPFFAVSIALEKESQLVLGVVYAPILNQLFTAELGLGAYLNYEPIQVSKTGLLNNALLGSGFPYYAWSQSANNSSQWTRLIRKVVSLRCDGAAALDLCYVAAGILDGFWELDLEPWDLAAGTLIIKEAGGKLSLVNGDPFTPYQRSVLASNDLLHDVLLSELISSNL